MNLPSPDDMETSIGFTEISSREEFEDLLKLDHAIIYILVDWSGSERISRYAVYKALYELDIKQIPLFKIDCSAQENRYVEDWLIQQRESLSHFYFGGNGETLFVVRGKILDFIGNPGLKESHSIKEKLEQWINLCQ